MKKYIGILLVIIGSLVFLTEIFPDYSAYISHLQAITIIPFWGVVLVLGGGYFLIGNEKAKSGLAAAIVIFIAIYALGSLAGTSTLEIGGWSVPAFLGGSEKIEGESRSIGTYQAKTLEMKNLAAEIRFTEVKGEKIEIITNLPLSPTKSESKVLIECQNDCKKYKNGELEFKVGSDLGLKEIKITDTVGDISVNLTQTLTTVEMANFVGALTVEGLSSQNVTLDDFIGDISLDVKTVDRLEVNSGIGDVKVNLPSDHRMELRSESLLSKLNTSGSVHQGDHKMEFSMRNMVGQVTVSKAKSN
jgi:hypothetical protein